MKWEMTSLLSKPHRVLDGPLLKAQDNRRRTAARRSNLSPKIMSFDHTSQLTVSVMSPSSSWLSRTPYAIDSPAMISVEESQYYDYIGSFYEGIGRAVEIGPWLGASTQCIVRSLARNPRFAGEHLHVIDDFIWRAAWMDPHVPTDEQLPNHACFRHLFDGYTRSVQNLLCVQQAKVTDYDGNEALPPFSWGEDPIEFLYVDCGRTMKANQAWYSYLRRVFIPGRTLLMMEDWRWHRERPRKSYNETLLFTESLENEIKLLHEVTDGGLATFLFTGS
jgi:hypothetical protein